ncbi:SGM_3592 family protein [Kitasatospora sp. NBC_01302]|uniref:SGM_3592 family protein n=1 Tax=Kitasatospora sp. NBC_01302 TaxID=2903575 RepID=UPI002E141185|nr:hypothetical protein OG294_33850 [Kitasatospora sp. NBC_01302]
MSNGDAPSEGPEDGTGPADDWDAVELDEAFVRSAPVVEPSGRARMLAARWRREPPQPEPWRSDRPPAGWFWSRVRKGRWRRGQGLS